MFSSNFGDSSEIQNLEHSEVTAESSFINNLDIDIKENESYFQNNLDGNYMINIQNLSLKKIEIKKKYLLF